MHIQSYMLDGRIGWIGLDISQTTTAARASLNRAVLINAMLISLHNRKYTHPTPGPARAHRRYLYLLLVVLFDLEMLGSIHFNFITQ